MAAADKHPPLELVRDELLSRAIPENAHRILDVGCGEGGFGAALKRRNPHCTVTGVETDPDAAARAASRLDRVFSIDPEQPDPPLDPTSFDCIVYRATIPQMKDPLAVLRRHSSLLADGGCIVCSIPNGQHYSVLLALIADRAGHSQESGDRIDQTRPLTSFGAATIQKLLVDASYAPQILNFVKLDCPPDVLNAMGPLFQLLRLHPARMQELLSAHEFIVRAKKYPLEPIGDEVERLSFVVCVNDEDQLKNDLLSSPCLGPGTLHQVLEIRGCQSVAECFEQALPRARNDWLICVHQDMYLPAGWDRRFVGELRRAEQKFGAVGVAGVYGVARTARGFAKTGHVLDRFNLIGDPGPLPAKVETLDEVVLAIRRGSGLRFDSALGFHFYGADVCLQARQRGLACVAIDALCMHNPRNTEIPPEFFGIAQIFARKWASELPLATPVVHIGPSGQMRTW